MVERINILRIEIFQQSNEQNIEENMCHSVHAYVIKFVGLFVCLLADCTHNHSKFARLAQACSLTQLNSV